ncbi:hypothetical protein Bbelb_153480 [Branchiostoma belcheri]|nr:hypothetical protein Bbelb_153480 [Branchiostoma belcheri]
MGCSSSPPLGHPWGYCSLGFVVACCGIPSPERCSLGCQPLLPQCRLSVLSTVYPAVTTLFVVASQTFLAVTGGARLDILEYTSAVRTRTHPQRPSRGDQSPTCVQVAFVQLSPRRNHSHLEALSAASRISLIACLSCGPLTPRSFNDLDND